MNKLNITWRDVLDIHSLDAKHWIYWIGGANELCQKIGQKYFAFNGRVYLSGEKYPTFTGIAIDWDDETQLIDYIESENS
jgi:hypothetical protein